MNLENVAMVRTMKHIPLDGILKPSCEDMYLEKDNRSDFYYIIKDYVKKALENKLGRTLKLWEETDMNLFNEAMQDYKCYSSYYTSTLSFSLNGLVPDDINNKFSNNKMAIIDPIKYHQDADFVNIDAIDTTIKGSLQLSSEAILVIDREYFLSLSEEIKNNLTSHYKIELFEGNLKEALKSTLLKYGYPALELIQSREKKDIMDCEEKEEMISFQDDFARNHNASRLKLQHLYMYPIESLDGVDAISAEKVKSDFDKGLVVDKYYKDLLYKFLLSKAEICGITYSDEEMYYLFSEYANSKDVLKKIVDDLITYFGSLEKMKEFIQEFNKYVLENYLTNDEIVALNGETRK